MRLIFIYACFFVFIFSANAQINLTDSTVKAIAYWQKSDKQTYSVLNESYKLNNEDTIDHQLIRYKIDVDVVDSLADAYILDWHYHDYEVEGNQMMKDYLSQITTNITVRVKTDEFGAFKEVLNWQELQQKVYDGIDRIKTQQISDSTKKQLLIDQLKQLYASKSAIETLAISDIHLFLSFLGVEYKFDNEITSTLQLPNVFGGEPFDTDVVIWLDEIDAQENDYLLRMNRVTDATQLTKATYDYLSSLALKMGAEKIKYEDFPLVMNNIWTASRFHNSGWLLQTIETKEVVSDGITQIDELTITLL